MSSPDQKPALKHAARRKLLRGAFAAPAVMTLYSGNALATSSSLRCLTNQVNGLNTTKTVAVSTSLDTWLRVGLYTTGTSPNFRYYVRGTDVVAFQRPGRTSFLSAGEFWEFNPATLSNSLIGSKLLTAPSGLSSTNCSQYVCVRFDAYGNITGCGTGPAGTAAMPGTCWASAAAFL